MERNIELTMRAIKQPASGLLTDRPHCLNCGEPLDLDQPQLDAPDRLLGTCQHCCNECGSWHLLNPTPDGSAIVIVLLPECQQILDAYSSAPDSDRMGHEFTWRIDSEDGAGGPH